MQVDGGTVPGKRGGYPGMVNVAVGEQHRPHIVPAPADLVQGFIKVPLVLRQARVDGGHPVLAGVDQVPIDVTGARPPHTADDFRDRHAPSLP